MLKVFTSKSRKQAFAAFGWKIDEMMHGIISVTHYNGCGYLLGPIPECRGLSFLIGKPYIPGNKVILGEAAKE